MSELKKKKKRSEKRKADPPESSPASAPEPSAKSDLFVPSDNRGDEAEPCSYAEYQEYVSVMESVNREYAVVTIGSDCLILNEYYDPVSARQDVRFLSFDSFSKRMMNHKAINPWRTSDSRKYRTVGSMWLSSSFRRTYDTVVFAPSGDVDERRYYNMFRGFAVEPKPGDWSGLRGHIKENICGRDEKLFDYVMGWMARIIQKPGGSRPGTALVLRGAQGCGKGILARSLGKLVGSHYRHILHLSHLTGKFNVHLKDAILVFCDEITWGGDRATEGILKGLITEPSVRVEPKGKDSLEVDSHINVIIASNNDWVIPAGLEERRFCVLDVLPDRIGDRTYFSEIYRQLENGGYEAMMHDLMHYDYSDIDLRTIPRTFGLFEQIVSSMSPVHKFWYQRLCDGTILLSDECWAYEVNCNTLYNAYLDFCETLGRRGYNIIKSQFSIKLKEICPLVRTVKKSSGTSRTYYYSFPGLAECRQDFENAINYAVFWEAESVTDVTDVADIYPDLQHKLRMCQTDSDGQ